MTRTRIAVCRLSCHALSICPPVLIRCTQPANCSDAACLAAGAAQAVTRAGPIATIGTSQDARASTSSGRTQALLPPPWQQRKRLNKPIQW
ncbi:hypothetical protein V8C86DRAFT_2775814 [Haematococcus lacustris]